MDDVVEADGADRIATSNLVFCIVASSLLVGTAVNLLRDVCPCQILTRLRVVIQAAHAAFKRQHETDDSDIGAIVKEKMRKLKLDTFTWSCKASWFVGSVMCVMLMATILLHPGMSSSWSKTALQLVVYASLSVATAFPAALSMKTIDWFSGIFMLAFTFYVSPWVSTNSEQALFYVVWVDLGVLYLNLITRPSLATVLALNLLYVVSSSANLIKHRDAMVVQVEIVVLIQTLFLTLIPMCSFFLEVGVASAIRRSVDWEAAKELFAAATALLRSCCDVVVELDADGVIVCPAQDLRGFLLRSPGCRLQDTPLVDLFSTEEDKALLTKKIRAPRPAGVSVAEAIHVHMRDGNNKLLKVEILSFEFRHMDGKPRHMAGLREFSDPPPTPAGRWRLDEEPEGSDALSDVDDNSASVGPSSRSDQRSDPYDVREAIAIVDTTDERLPIRGCSSGFQMHIGRLAPGSCLQDLLMPSCRGHFTDWMNMAATYGSDWPNSRVTLSLRRGQIKVSCRVAQESEDEVIDPARVHLVFQNIRFVRGHSDGSGGCKAHANFKGTPVAPAVRMAL